MCMKRCRNDKTQQTVGGGCMTTGVCLFTEGGGGGWEGKCLAIGIVFIVIVVFFISNLIQYVTVSLPPP